VSNGIDYNSSIEINIQQIIATCYSNYHLDLTLTLDWIARRS